MANSAAAGGAGAPPRPGLRAHQAHCTTAEVDAGKGDAVSQARAVRTPQCDAAPAFRG